MAASVVAGAASYSVPLPFPNRTNESPFILVRPTLLSDKILASDQGRSGRQCIPEGSGLHLASADRCVE
jgi:hypothetical protein